MLSGMLFITVALLGAGACLRDFLREPNRWDAIWFLVFFLAGIYFQLVLIGRVLQDAQVLTHV